MDERVAMPIAVALTLLLLGAGSARAQTKPLLGPAATSPAATSPAHPGIVVKAAVDRSTPDKTWAALCAAVKSGDLTGFRACCYNKNEISTLFMDSYSDTVITTFQLGRAVSKLGTDGQTLSKTLQSQYADLIQTGMNRTTKIDLDHATWTRTVSSPKLVAEDTMYFKKVGNDWLLDTQLSYHIDTDDGRKSAEAFIKDAGPALKLLKGIVADIDAGKITTMQQVKDRMAAM